MPELVFRLGKKKEEGFTPVITSIFQARVWGDLMQLQERCMMDLINISTGFCARISRTDMSTSITTVVVTSGILPAGDLHCLDFNAVAGDRRRILMVIEARGGQPESPQDLALSLSRRALHKFGTTLPIPTTMTRFGVFNQWKGSILVDRIARSARIQLATQEPLINHKILRRALPLESIPKD